ncbi:PaaI family thioesterase [Salinarimonas soli]|uniref:Medium/long-chain acyl-CoA thioesterase YigI n=1 Tax=Salinarimonas soli TaxID=1638099 RepID=A0A5B2VVF6_9HYPH|nr:PaaI family thioesterase [Salinarimonas soli]KAA2242247.1 PaaI family thioesterase [Salinarimonas soli]
MPGTPDFAERVARSFARQGLMETIGARLATVRPGEVEIVLDVTPRVSQQHGFVHAGAVSSIADSAAGYAGLTVMPAEAGVLTVEFKINLLAPAAGERLFATGRVVRAGRSIVVAQAEVEAESAGRRKPVALLTATLMAIQGRDGVAD